MDTFSDSLIFGWGRGKVGAGKGKTGELGSRGNRLLVGRMDW